MNAASNNTRILVMPGVYLGDAEPWSGAGRVRGRLRAHRSGQFALSYEEHRQCPNAQNLIAVLGDTNGDRLCDAKCNIQIEGTGPSRTDALLSGDRSKLNILRADRADGIYIKNLMFQFSDFNNIYVLETNGFRIDNVLSRWSREYGILSFTSDHGIYENCETLRQRRLGRSTRAPAPTATASPTLTATSTGSRSATATRTTTTSGPRARPATAPGTTTTGSTTTRSG